MKRQAGVDPLKAQAEFDRNLNAGKLSPVYVLEGKEAYLREQAVNRLLEAAVDEGMRAFNFARISVSDGDLGKALALARQYPMISARRMVVVTDFEAVNDDRQLELLKDYLRAPGETTVLAFVSAGLDNRRAIATALRKTATVVNFDPLDEKESAPRWVLDYVKRNGCAMEMSDASYLIGTVGVELQRLTNELEKLICFVGGKGRIGKAEIDALVVHTREHSNFELTDALLDGRRERALRLLGHIFDNPPEAPQTLAIMMLGALARGYRNLLLAKELMRQNAAQEEIAKAVGMSPYAVRYLNERARKADINTLLKAIARIAATDVALKSSLATPQLQMELLICELCPSG
ncbi:MAG: DNA polymerase III subunit delta [Acidobacteria bacterium]|nr:DNA polymerase III subunit delta [Acidobacteriota bacterium]MBI3425732.1 DNA polymerase III subunit delta [Acidobacteriota bacterium]